MSLYQIGLYDEPTLTEEDGDDVYKGYPQHGRGLDTGDPVWGISLLKTLENGETQLCFPNGSKMKEFIWTSKDQYTYLPFGA